MVLQVRKWCDWWICWMDFFLLLLGTNAAREVLCWNCTEGHCSSVLLHGICLSRCLCSAIFGRVVSCWIFFLCLPYRLSVCLCVYFGYLVPVQRNVCPLILLPVFCVAQIPAMSDILLLGFSHSCLQERTRMGFVLWLCAHQAVLFTFTLLDCWICIDFLYPLHQKVRNCKVTVTRRVLE